MKKFFALHNNNNKKNKIIIKIHNKSKRKMKMSYVAIDYLTILTTACLFPNIPTYNAFLVKQGIVNVVCVRRDQNVRRGQTKKKNIFLSAIFGAHLQEFK